MIETHTIARAEALSLEPRIRGPNLPTPPSIWQRLRSLVRARTAAAAKTPAACARCA